MGTGRESNTEFDDLAIGEMTAKEFVQAIYPEARVVRWHMSQACISIATDDAPYRTLGWAYHRESEDEEIIWLQAKRTIQEMMLEKLES
jgi:hypothetical protein